MTRLLTLLRTRLALRTTAIILMIVGLLGLLFMSGAVYLSAKSEQRKQVERLEELLSTVERTAQVACFLGDQHFGEEVIDGLLSNRVVNAARIRLGDGSLLAQGRSEGVELDGSSVARVIMSPFDAEDAVCSITLTPNQQRIDALVRESSLFIGLVLVLQLTGIGICVVLVVVRFVTRPITGISHRLSELEAETGQKLKIPRGNQGDEIGQLVTSVNAMIDNLVETLGKERRLRLAREVEERRYRAIFDNVEAGIFELDDEGWIRAANPAFRTLFDIIGARDLEQYPQALTSLVSSGAPGPEALRGLLEGEQEQRHWEVALGDERQQRWVNLILSPLETGRIQGVAQDITASKTAAAAAERMAITDALTGLGNRRGLDHRLAVIARHHRFYPERGHALLVLDFDHFKQINDTYGHHAGDRVLRHVGDILSQLVRQRDYVARLGGDEFVLLLDGCSRREEVERLLQRFVEQLATPISLPDGEKIVIGASVGIAILGRDTDDPQQAMQYADMAMYAAKRAGRNAWRFHGDDRPEGASR
ncbi:diguanylate cyclase domain-containing protein [Salinicola avicenniae]|uniref:diguanylate cyclase domain-containing protein n=1 Tax=Salinicola avicenniae TaxID=2916836 RepID=UPI0020745F99|nr:MULTISPECIES: diguanylate cyclase [unclassified Salinicola]